MKKPRYNPYKYSTIVLFIIVVTFFAFSDDWTVPYYILSGSGVVFLGILTTNFMVADKNILTWIGSFLLYTFISSMTLGPILYLVIPHFADELLFANIMTIKDGSYQSKHTLIWNGPIDGVVLSKGQNYIYNDTDKPIYLIAATYTPTHSRRPFFDNLGPVYNLKKR